LEEIERRHAKDLSADAFQRQYIATNTPVIVVGAMDGFAAMSRWRLDELATTHGKLPVAVARDAYVTRPEGVATLASFLAQLGTAEAKWCYAFQDISKDPVRYDSLWDAFEIPGFVSLPKREACVVSRFYVGAAGDGATPHIHSETINLLADGTKEWLLCPPSDLAAFEQDYELAAHARWFRDTRADDRGCQGWRGTQSSGEILFVPRVTYHATLNQTHTVGVTWRWDPAISVPTHQPELPETIELEGVTLRRLGTSEVPGAAIGLFGISSDGQRPDPARPFLFKIIPTERDRASTVLADLGARLTPIIAKLIENRMRMAGSSGFVIAPREDGTFQVHDTILDYPDARETLLELFIGESCFNETVRRGLIGR
jgi:hypothetical protein